MNRETKMVVRLTALEAKMLSMAVAVARTGSWTPATPAEDAALARAQAAVKQARHDHMMGTTHETEDDER